MATNNAPTEKGRQASEGLKQAAKQEERKVEAETGRDLKKGEERFEERSRSSDGKSAGTKQK